MKMNENSKKYIKTLKNNKKVYIYFKIFSYTIIKNIQFLTHFLYKNFKHEKTLKTDLKPTEYKEEFFGKID